MQIALVFPGQGSQSVGMLGPYAGHPRVRETFAEASAFLGQDLWALVENGPEEALSQTTNTQPVMLTADVAVFRAWRASGGPSPAMVAGHSLGEYAALVAADALSFEDALVLVRARAEAMQRAVPEGVGGIAAILGLDEDGVRNACRDAAQGQVVEAANLNAPGQIVIAGHRPAVERAIEIAKAMGAKRAVLLAMSVPSHCSLMAGAGEALREHLSRTNIRPPAIPVINNADVASPQDPVAIRAALVRQLSSPVRWIESVNAMVGRGAGAIVECGPGKVLAGLVKRIAPSVATLSLSSSESITDAIGKLK